MMMTIAPVSMLFNRLDIDSLNQRTVSVRTISDSASFTLCGSSRMIRSPRSPVDTPPTELASFHPDFVFADADPDDIANATNRAPAPILHLLREDSIARAAAAVPDAADIYERNIATMERLGPEGWAEMVAKFSEKPHHD